jgi:hypothetical protein
MKLCSLDCIVCKWIEVWGPPPDKRTILIHRDLGNMVGIGRSVVDWDEED